MDSVPITKKLIAFGSNKVYLPKFTVALIRTPRLSPYHARFLVPLDFSKYDLRDYLYHAYNVRCFNIRSIVQQMPVRDTRELPRHWFRPDSKKYMTVEMEQPFVWPELSDLSPWDRKEKIKDEEDAVEANGLTTPKMAREESKRLRDQVRKLLAKEPERNKGLEKKVKAKEWLSEPEQKTWSTLQRKRKDMAKLSELQAWEKARPLKITTSGEQERFIVKA